MKKFFIALFIALAGIAVAQTIPNFSSQINTTFPDNTSGQITPAAVRAFEQALINLFGAKQDYPAVTQTCGTNDTTVATTAYVHSCAGGGGGSGTVTSVGATVPTGLAVSGSPITTSGTLAFSWSGTIPAAQLPFPSSVTLGGVESGAASSSQVMTGISTSGVPQFNALPNPTASTLGGIKSASASATQVMTGVATSGSPQFGALPNPAASTLGGVESASAPSNQWMTGINTSGVPQFSQPGFSNLSGNIAVSQMNSGTGATSSTCWLGNGTWGSCSTGSGTVTTSGTMTSGDCVKSLGGTVIADAGTPCGSGSGTNLGWVNIQTYGATGDGTCHALSGAYANLAAAQAVYPFVSDLTQCIDWAATQQAINVAFANSPVNNSATVYCPSGNYQLSNPLMFDSANGIQGSYTAWASGTTYANAANVTYNGLPWISMGSGNIGNPPTSQALFPQQLQIASNGTTINQAGFPWGIVSISNGSPAVITVLGGGISVSNNSPVVFFTQQFANPNGGSAPALPSGINANQVYYVKNVSSTTFNISTTPGGSNVNTSGVGVGTFFVTPQVWQVAPVSNGTDFSNRVSFIGDEGITSNGGCHFHTQYNWTTPVIFLSGQNGGLIKGIYVVGNAPLTDGSNTYTGARCTSPFSVSGVPTSSSPAGPSVVAAGWALMANGGGSRTKFENVGASLLHTGTWIGYGTNGELADQNTWEKPLLSENCVGINFGETQAFINSIYEASSNDNDTGVIAYSQEGAKIIGGNFSTGIANSTSFAVTSVSSTSGCGFLCVTATITSPDNYLQTPMCAYAAGQAVNAGARWLNAWPFSFGCGYNTFIMNVPHWGLIGMYVANYVPTTGVITLAVPAAWAGIYQGTCCGSDLATQIATVTKLYAAEATVPFFGDMQVDTVHIENDGTPTTISAFGTKFFGGARPAELRNIFLNTEASLGSLGCCNRGLSDKYVSQWAGQQVIPFINSTLGDTIIDYLTGGFNGTSAPTSIYKGNMDRVLIATETSSYVEGRHMMGTNNTNISTGSGGNNAAGPLFDFANSSIGTEWLNTVPLVNPGTLGQLSGGYYAMGGSAYGTGLWDNPSNFVSSAAFSVNGSNQPVNQADLWRSRGWGQSRYWGIRPEPSSNPCILPSQAVSLASLPTITYTAQLQDFLHVSNGGTGYAVNDTITLSGGTGTAAVVFVTGVSGSTITSVQVQSQGSYTSTLPTTFGQTSTSGGGSSATFSLPVWYVNYAIGYPLLWGGHIYHACDYNNANFAGPKYAIKSTHTGWTYGQNLTTSNVPNLAWTMDGASPFVYFTRADGAPNLEALELMFPGLLFSLTGTGGCSGTETFIVLEVHPSAGYVKVVRADNDGSGNYLPALAASGTTCSGTTVGQASFNLVNPY